jgi:4-hydroxybenzoate polyprenyltransferase
MSICLASGLVIYSVYTLDRALGSEEDTINREELNGSSKEIGLTASIITFVIGSYALAKEGLLIFAFLPFVTGFLYSKGIKIGKFALKLKGGLGVKNIVVGLTWGACTAGIAGYSCELLPLAIVFILFGVKTFINSTIDDFKDIKGDSIAGLRTLPVCLGRPKTQWALLALHIISHLVLLITLFIGIIAFEPVIIAGSFICGLVCILRYTNEERYKSGKLGLAVFKDLEAALIIVFRITYSFIF